MTLDAQVYLPEACRFREALKTPALKTRALEAPAYPVIPDPRGPFMPKFTLNGEVREVNVPGANPLLWVLRESLGLTGTKFGCGIGQCGACTVLLNGQPIRSCSFPVSAAEGGEITTIEGLSTEGLSTDGGHPVQQAWIEEQVPPPATT